MIKYKNTSEKKLAWSSIIGILLILENFLDQQYNNNLKEDDQI